MVKRDPKTIAEAVEMAVQWLSTRPRGVVVTGDGDGYHVLSHAGLALWVAGTLVDRNQNQRALVADFYRRRERKAVRGTVPTEEIVDLVLAAVRKRLQGEEGE